MKNSKHEALRWYLQAEDDRKFAEWVLKEGVFFDKGCFLAQQAGEKVFKACLYASEKRTVLGHSLIELGAELAELAPEFSKIKDQSRRLDRLYIPTRYPNGLPGGTPLQNFFLEDLQEAVTDLKAVFEVCQSYLQKLEVLG